MGVRRYGTEGLARRAADRAAALDTLAAALKPLLAALPPLPRPRYPADARWNARRRRDRQERWLLVGRADGSGFVRRPGPYRLAATCAVHPGSVVYYGKNISVRYESDSAAPALRCGGM
jgi:hypothetical protein